MNNRYQDISKEKVNEGLFALTYERKKANDRIRVYTRKGNNDLLEKAKKDYEMWDTLIRVVATFQDISFDFWKWETGLEIAKRDIDQLINFFGNVNGLLDSKYNEKVEK